MKTNTKETKKFAAEIGCSDFLSAFLISRGIDTKEKYEHFVNMKAANLRKVTTMKDADLFLQKLNAAVDAGKEITVYGDYDCDGIMATCIVMFSLLEIGRNKVNWFVNNRFTEGYGMNKKGVEHLLEMYPNTQMIITVDNGIRANEGIRFALDQGIEVIVSDHHKQVTGDSLPDCPVVCESRLDESEELKESICGAEVARRLMSELFVRRGIAMVHREFLNGLCAYSGFATITDSVPMNAANHCIAKIALRLISKDYALIWKVLNKQSKMQDKQFTQDTIGFTYGPMFNAPGRVTGSVDIAMAALIKAYQGDEAGTNEAVETLIGINEQRKTWSKQDDEKAFEMAEQYENDRFILLESEDFREGINGLTSSHITEHYKVPSIVLCPVHGTKDLYKGSGRCVEGINLFGLLEECRDLMVGFGGHPMAAGLTVKKDDIPKLRAKLAAITPENPHKDKTGEDFRVTPDDITLDLIDEFDSLIPFGEGFAKPAFLLDATIISQRVMNDRHWKFLTTTPNRKSGHTTMYVIWWNSVESSKAAGFDPQAGDSISCIGMPSINNFNGSRYIQLIADKVFV